MELDRRSVWNQSKGKIHTACDAIRLRQLHTHSREITYQSFGLDRKKQVERLAFFLVRATGLGRGAASEKARGFRLFSAPWSSVALTTVQVVIHFHASFKSCRSHVIKIREVATRAISLILVRATGLEPALFRTGT